MKKLSGDQKLFIVQRLAQFETPTEVVAAVKVEFGIEVTPQHVRTYNPEQCEVVARWRKEFDAARKRFREKIENIPIANVAVRLQWLNDSARLAKARGQHQVVKDMVELAEKIQGGFFTNRRALELSGYDGEPFKLIVETARNTGKPSGGTE